MRAVVIGGGLGGMAAAARLAKLGHDVTLVEARAELGGALRPVEHEGFVWDGGAHATLLPAVEKRGPAGVIFDIPLKHITDATIRSHHQTVEVRIADAPHPGEIVIALAAAAQGRPQQRLAALSTEQ